MNPFQYATAQSPEEAMSLVGKNGRYLGGGIDLLDEMKEYIVSPDLLVALRLPRQGDPVTPAEKSLQIENIPAGTIFIDSQMTVTELAVHPDILSRFPGLAEAAGEVGSPQIRNVATVGGNLLQHSRCWYYRQPDITCLKRGGSTCYGQDGENKYLSLFSGCACISPIASNLAVALTALDAELYLREKIKATPVRIHDFYAPAWTSPEAHNALPSGALLTGVIVSPKRTRSAYRQMSEKSEFDWALVSCAAAGNVKDGKITDARVALGGVAPVPYVVAKANHFLEDKPLNEDTASQAADLILADAKPLAHNGYKVPLAHTLIRRTLLALNP